MLIRSQDKKTIFDMSGCTLRINLENEVYGFGNDSLSEDPPTILGYYSTEERAIEVLDEICNAYISLNKHAGREYNGNHISGYFGGYVKNGIFQMPEV